MWVARCLIVTCALFSFLTIAVAQESAPQAGLPNPAPTTPADPPPPNTTAPAKNEKGNDGVPASTPAAPARNTDKPVDTRKLSDNECNASVEILSLDDETNEVKFNVRVSPCYEGPCDISYEYTWVTLDEDGTIRDNEKSAAWTIAADQRADTAKDYVRPANSEAVTAIKNEKVVRSNCKTTEATPR